MIYLNVKICYFEGKCCCKPSPQERQREEERGSREKSALELYLETGQCCRKLSPQDDEISDEKDLKVTGDSKGRSTKEVV